MNKEKKDNRILKTILVFGLVFIGIPLLILLILYFSNNDFNKAMNDHLRKAPGVVGEHFDKYPTENEKEDKELFLANYYLTLDKESASDKLYIIKKNDEELFNNVVKRMNSVSSGKTSEIIKSVRNIELRKDLLFTIYEEIQDEQSSKLANEVKQIEKMDLQVAINEVEKMLSNNNIKTTSSIFEKMKEKPAVEILYFLGTDDYNKILSNINDVKKRDLEILLFEKKDKENELKSLAKLYEAKDTIKAFGEIGNTDIYKIEELAIIYMNMSIRKASEILVNNDDEQFISELFTNIEKQERLRGINDSMTPSIAETMNYINQYNSRIDELVALYEKMNATEAAKIVEKMVANKTEVTSLEIEDNSLYKISDSIIITDVLKKMRKQNLSQILSSLDSKKAAEITRTLAMQ
ncbi:hypothetical protein [Brassicibacter mesophilus]|uniref:hypothetical protein n=1 Tax=Brassicibacter mesophilus TaxID=745119 RepID=UPI003D249DDE